MEEFPPNSNVSKEKAKPQPEKPQKELEKVVSGEVVKRKKPLGRRFKEVFFAGDFKTAAGAVMMGVALPAIKNLIFDAGQEALRRVLWNAQRDPRVHRRASGNDYNPTIRYDRISSSRSDPRGDPRGRDPRRNESGNYNIGELIVPSSSDDADMVLEKMRWIIDNYDVVSVGDLYELLGLPSAYTDNNWGWSNLVNAEVKAVREGWLLDLPDPEPI